MEKIYVRHYVLGTYGDDERTHQDLDLSVVAENYDKVTQRITSALIANNVEEPRNLIAYSFQMLGGFRNGTFHRRELVVVDPEQLRVNNFPWENWTWVQAFQPLVDVAGYTIVEIDRDYPSFGPSVDHPLEALAPFYSIYENGKEDQPKPPESWFTRIKHDVMGPAADTLKRNLPAVLAVGTSVAAIALMVKTSQDAAATVESATDAYRETIRHMEETLDDAIDMPQVVRVELGDDIEVIGTGHKTW